MADNKSLSQITAATQNELLDETLAHIRNSPVDRSITLEQLATYIGSKINKNEVYANAFINGCMQIDQRNAGAPVVGVINGQYVIDRFLYGHNGTMVYNSTQDTDVPNSQYQYSLKTTITTADTSVAANDYMLLGQIIEGYNFAPYVGIDATFSCWMKSTLAGVYCVSFRNGGIDRAMVKEITLPADTWTLIQFPLTFNASGGTWNYTNGIGLNVKIALMAGTTAQTAPDVWQTGNLSATSNQVNFAESTHSFWMTDMKLNEGLIRYPYQPFAYQRTLRDCQRYFYKIGNPSSIVALHNGGAYTTVNGVVTINPPEEMRTIPTLAVTGSLSSTDYTARTLPNASQNITALATTQQDQHNFGLDVTVGAGFTAQTPFSIYTASGKYITFDAEL